MTFSIRKAVEYFLRIQTVCCGYLLVSLIDVVYARKKKLWSQDKYIRKYCQKKKNGVHKVKNRVPRLCSKCSNIAIFHDFFDSEGRRKFSNRPNRMFWVLKSKFNRCCVRSKKNYGHRTNISENIVKREQMGSKKRFPAPHCR